MYKINLTSFQNLVSKKGLAHDILWALTGRDLYRMLVIEQHWTSDQYENWLGQVLINMLISDDNNAS